MCHDDEEHRGHLVRMRPPHSSLLILHELSLNEMSHKSYVIPDEKNIIPFLPSSLLAEVRMDLGLYFS